MDTIGYNIPIQPRPKRQSKIYKLVVIGFVLSLFFLRHGDTVTMAIASDILTDPPPAINNMESYLQVKEGSPIPPVYSKSFLLMDLDSGEVLVSKNPNDKVPVASTTKLVTALLARDLFDLNEVVTIQKLAATINGSEIELAQGERITVRDLLKGLLIQSGNDAAFALAEHYSQKPGDYQLFVVKMNEYVSNIGLVDTVFGDPAGLDDEVGRSTAWDLAHISRLLLRDNVLAEMVAIPKTTVASIDGKYLHSLESSNRLILSDSIYYLPGAIGIKTGFTPEAGHCLVSAYDSGGKVLIGIVLNTNELSITASASESKKLYSWANSYIERVSY